MTFLADENFPRQALEALRNAGWDVASIAETCPGASDEEVGALCAARHPQPKCVRRFLSPLKGLGAYRCGPTAYAVG